MSAVNYQLSNEQAEWKQIWLLAQREIRDSLRDWRIVIPIFSLVLVFPILGNIVAERGIGFIGQYGATLITERLLPFIILVVGFFPSTFSLIIGLETFAGEKERRSLEPLLATPLSDGQLYLGKLLASTFLPVLASYVGMTAHVLLTGLRLHWWPPVPIMIIALVLSTTEALVMVTAAVIVSSQSTSVRAANLLSSFIILPMAFLVQWEASLLLFGNYTTLWLLALFMLVVDGLLVRLGTRVFNREHLLGRELDAIDVQKTWRDFRAAVWPKKGGGWLLFLVQWELGLLLWRNAGREALAVLAGLSLLEGFWVLWRRRGDWTALNPLPVLRAAYRALGDHLRDIRLEIAFTLLVMLGGGIGVGWWALQHFPLPQEVMSLAPYQDYVSLSEAVTESGLLESFTGWAIWANNVRSLLAAAFLGAFSMGILAQLMLLAPVAIIVYLVPQVGLLNLNPWAFFAVTVLPHGVLELPLAIIATAQALRIGAILLREPARGGGLSGMVVETGRFVRLMVLLVVPLLLVAAYIEALITPVLVIRYLFGG